MEICLTNNIDFLIVEIQFDQQINMRVVIVRGPNEDDNINKKEEFWEDLTQIVEDTEGKLLIQF